MNDGMSTKTRLIKIDKYVWGLQEMEGLRVEIGLKEPSRGSCRDDQTGTIRQGRPDRLLNIVVMRDRC